MRDTRWTAAKGPEPDLEFLAHTCAGSYAPASISSSRLALR